jgi:uncharacterized protein with von Willebrand factor type A (vWA) domain
MIFRKTSLAENIVQFCRFLRKRNFAVGVDEETTALQALTLIDHTSPIIFRAALKATLSRSKQQVEEFDDLFDEYWKQLSKAVDAKTKNKQEKQTALKKQVVFKSLKTWLHGNRNNETEETATYSLQQSLSQKDFSSVPEEDIDELMQMIRALAKRMAAKASRRYRSSHREDMPDLRQTLRRNLRRGGELLELAWRKPKQNRIKILLLCDVSKSMELYSAFLLQFMYAFQQVYSRMETFAFGTSLKRITPLLKEQNFRKALQLLQTETDDWSGGTRIGECLNDFVNNHSKKMLDFKTIVIIISDGWDSGDMQLLQQSMGYIHRKSRKLIWLNPLAGYASYRAYTSGMQTAMPFIDVFAPVHNAETLRQLGRLL